MDVSEIAPMTLRDCVGGMFGTGFELAECTFIRLLLRAIRRRHARVQARKQMIAFMGSIGSNGRLDRLFAEMFIDPESGLAAIYAVQLDGFRGDGASSHERFVQAVKAHLQDGFPENQQTA